MTFGADLQNVTLLTQAYLEATIFTQEKHVKSILITSFIYIFPYNNCPPITFLQYTIKIYSLFSQFTHIYPHLPTKVITKRQIMENFMQKKTTHAQLLMLVTFCKSVLGEFCIFFIFENTRKGLQEGQDLTAFSLPTGPIQL